MKASVVYRRAAEQAMVFNAYGVLTRNLIMRFHSTFDDPLFKNEEERCLGLLFMEQIAKDSERKCRR